MAREFAGALNKRVTFKRKDGTKDSYGTDDVAAKIEIGTVWGAVEPLVGREFIAALQTQANLSVRIRCRYSSITAQVTTTCSAECEGKVYDITAILDPKSRHEELQFMCTDHNG